MKSAARSQAGFDHARLRILPDEDPAASRTAAASAKSQAQLVREATARKPHALIVEAEDTGDAELAQGRRSRRGPPRCPSCCSGGRSPG